ncbi:membrane hypothetical protein [mine drainage metagenome]|uniref:Uncharacterized protein n=1 Tax=mine drainage metagenome TaxID=410659 RepID=A0A3P3ZRK1_9ZZZZ
MAPLTSRWPKSCSVVVLVAALVADAIWAHRSFPGGTREFWIFGSPAAWIVWLLLLFTVTHREDRRTLAIIVSIVAVALFFIALPDPCGGPFALSLLGMLPAAVLVSIPLLGKALLVSISFVLLASVPRRLRFAAIPLWIPWVLSIIACLILVTGGFLIGTHWQGTTPCDL